MNPKLLKKCLDELDADMPRMDYIRGILETLYESETEKNPVARPLVGKLAGEIGRPDPERAKLPMSEGDALDVIARERLKGIKDIAE